MKKHLIAMAALFGGLTLGSLAVAQEGDAPAPTPEPQSIVDGAIESYSGGTISSGGYIDGGTAIAPVRPLHHHPAPLYARGRRGRRATSTHDWNMSQAAGLPWHGGYYQAQYGQPVALVVPPTAGYISNYGWGVGNTTSTPIYHQFNRYYPGPASGGNAGMFQATPLWPSNTNQFGYYPVRGPW